MVWPALSSVSSETHLHERAKESPVDVQPDQQCQKRGTEAGKPFRDLVDRCIQLDVTRIN